MGNIYKVENKLNGNIYIGQTIRTINTRWRDHVRAAQTRSHKDYHLPLHNAIRLYGEDNFTVTLIEECPNELLNEKEKYWIEYYDSYKNGYNASLGGFGHQKYNYQEIVQYYLDHGNTFIDTCLHFNIYDQVLYNALQALNIDYKSLKNTNPRKKHNKWILLEEKKIVFKRMTDVDKYFNKKVHGHIRHCLDGLIKTAYGYHWKEIEKDADLDNLGYTLFTPERISI